MGDITDLANLTWAALKWPPTLALLLATGVIQFAKRLGAKGRVTLLVALLGGQLFAQMAFWRERGWGADVMADAFLAGFVASVLAVGGHQTLRALAGGSWERAPPSVE